MRKHISSMYEQSLIEYFVNGHYELLKMISKGAN